MFLVTVFDPNIQWVSLMTRCLPIHPAHIYPNSSINHNGLGEEYTAVCSSFPKSDHVSNGITIAHVIAFGKTSCKNSANRCTCK